MFLVPSILSLVMSSLPYAHLSASDGVKNDIFGMSVALHGTHVLVGAPKHGAYGYHAGGVYAFESDGQQWTEVQKLHPDDLEEYGEFGGAIDVQGDLAAVGWKGGMVGDVSTGLVVLYHWDGNAWNEIDRLEDPSAEEGDYFGSAVQLDGDQLIVGCQFDDENGTHSGSALIFQRVEGDWNFQQRLVPSQGAPFTWAGRSVAIDGDLACVGAYFETVDDVPAAGAAYIYRRGTDDQWEEEARVVAEEPQPGDYFGYSLSLLGDRLAVGSILNDAPNEDSGAVFLYEHVDGAWVRETLSPPDIGGEFGYTVSLEDDVLLVGAVYNPGNGFASGAVYRFEWDGGAWHWRGKWLPMSGTDDCFYGAALDMDGSTAAVGSPREDTSGIGSGAVYIREIGLACSADVNDDVRVNVMDLLAIVAAWGSCGGCIEDINSDGFVNVNDLLMVISGWGNCP